MIKLTDVEPNDIGFTRILSCAELYFNNIDSEVPIPKDCFGFTVSVTISPFSRPCEVDIEIVDLIINCQYPELCFENNLECVDYDANGIIDILDIILILLNTF